MTGEITRAASEMIAAYEAQAVAAPWIDTGDLTRAIGRAQRRLGEPIKLSFVGNFSVGKSNIINSLLREKVAPVGVNPTTAVICHFRWGEERRLRMHYRDGRVEEGELLAFKRFSDHRQLEEEEGELIRSMAYVEVFSPSEALRNITLVDTPGFGSASELDDEVTRGHLQEADAVCWVFDAQEVGKADEVQRVRQLAPNFRMAFAVVNKCDEKPGEERVKLKRRVEEVLGDCFDGGVLLYSADVVQEFQEDPSLVDEDELAHLCMDLRAEIGQRVKAHSDQLRARHAESVLMELAQAHREVTAAYLGELAEGLAVFEARMPVALAAHRRRLSRVVEEERDALARRLTTIPTRHLTRLERSIEVDRGIFRTNVSLNSDNLNALWKELEDSIHETFGPWQMFVSQIAVRTTAALNAVDLGQVFIDNPELSALRVQLVDKLGNTVQHWSEFIPAVLHFGPLNRALGSVDGFLRTLYNVHHIPTVLAELAQLKGARLAKFVAESIDLTLPLEILDERLRPQDGATPWIMLHIDESEAILAVQAAEIRARMVIAFDFVAWLEERWLKGTAQPALKVSRWCGRCEGETAVGFRTVEPACGTCGALLPAWR